jgi:hypothetical protein
MENLAKKYPKVDFNNLTEKNIIYFCRDALSYYNTDHDSKKAVFEAEILEIIKSKEWNWNATDIDKNIILTYPVYNYSLPIVQYLLENEKYNIKEYNKTISNALGSSITIFGGVTLNYLLNLEDMDIMYRTDLAIKSYQVASGVEMNYHKQNYLEKALAIFQTETLFTNIVGDFVAFPSNYKNIKEPLHHLLENHPLDIDSKVNIVKGYLNPELCNPNKLISEVLTTLENWSTYYSLNKDLAISNSTHKKPKI